MKGADLKCPTCGREAADVADNYSLAPSGFGVSLICSTAWTCRNGHRNMIDIARTDDGEMYIAREETIR